MSDPAPASAPPRLVTAGEIGERLGVKSRSVHMWRHRQNGFPEPVEYVGRIPRWDWAAVLAWAGTSGHIHNPDTRAAYRRQFGKEAEPPRRGGRPADTAPFDSDQGG